MPVVLLHGFPGGASDWDGVADELGSSSRVLVPDLLGFGGSRRPSTFDELWVDAQAAALGEALTACGVERATFIGHDYGGPVALRFAATAPQRVERIALASTNVFADTPVPFPLAAVRWPVVGNAAAAALFSRPSLAMLARRASRGTRPTANDAGEVRTIRTIFTRVLRNLPGLYGPLEASLAGLTVPRIVIWGADDPIFPLAHGRRTAAALQAELVVLADTGHFTPAERPAEFAAAIRKLLARA